jgi:hypothetical protein
LRHCSLLSVALRFILFQRKPNVTDPKRALCAIMSKVHALAEIAWPRDGEGRSAMPEAGMLAIIDCQEAAAKALGLPEDLDLMTGDALIDLT